MNIIKERISPANGSYRLLKLKQTEFGGARHRHRQIELTWIQRGTGLRIVGDHVAPFEADDLVLIGANTPHIWLSAPEHRGEPHIATVLQFAPELFERSGVAEFLPASAFLSRANSGLKIEGATRRIVTNVLMRIPTKPSILGLAALFELVGLLVLHQAEMKPLATRATRSSGVSRADIDQRVTRVFEWVYENIERKLSVEHAAAIAHISPSAFSRFFAREAGRSFTQYVNDLRCSEACIKLRNTDRPIALIAQDCGFETMSHFNRQFRERHRVTPREFRNGRGESILQ
jgi:AraC-like DNA-binding protein